MGNVTVMILNTERPFSKCYSLSLCALEALPGHITAMNHSFNIISQTLSQFHATGPFLVRKRSQESFEFI